MESCSPQFGAKKIPLSLFFFLFFVFFNQVGEPHVWRRDMLYNGDLNFVYYIMFETPISGNKVRVKLRLIYDCQRKGFITRKIEWIRGKQKILTLGYKQTAYPLINSTLKIKSSLMNATQFTPTT